MRLEPEKVARLALLWSGTVGAAGLDKLIAAFGSARAAIAAGPDGLLSSGLRLTPDKARRIASLARRLAEFEDLWRMCLRRFIHVIFREDDRYPLPLREIPNPPWVLSLYGAWLNTDDPAVAIVGTRNPTSEGLSLASELAAACASRGITVVSGLARGIDQAAHRGALAAGGRTIAVIGSGLLALDPRRTGGLEREIAGRGAVISELGPHSPAATATLMARNRLISGLSRAVIVVQSRRRGGALATANYAVKQRRILAAVPWPDQVPEGAGCNILLSGGAQPITSPADMSALLDTVTSTPWSLYRSGPAQLSLFDDQASGAEPTG